MKENLPHWEELEKLRNYAVNSRTSNHYGHEEKYVSVIIIHNLELRHD